MLLETHDLTKSFAGPAGTVRALAGVSISLDAGEFLAVRGPSGCGKTTLLLTVGGLQAPSRGSVTVDGQDPYDMSADARAAFRAGKIGFVFQQFHLVPYLTVMENALAPALAGAKAGLRDRAAELVGQLGLADRAGHLPAMLSTGERQRVAVARALLRGPRLLLADEPTGNLDEASAKFVLEQFVKFAAGGGAVMLATHDDRAAARAAKTVHMAAGAIAS